MFKSPRWRLFLGLVVGFALLIVALWWINNRRRTKQSTSAENSASSFNRITVQPLTTVTPTPAQRTTVPSDIPDATSPPAVGPTQIPSGPPAFVGELRLIIPVTGVKQEQLVDTFADARSEGRVHDAIDIPAPQGTAVVAAADGEIIKLFQSERGGITIYQVSTDRKLVFYYAHLQGYAPNLVEGMRVRQGQTIAYVGDTGNAGTGNYHLHFSIAIVSDPKRYWEGTNIDPYPVLRNH